MWHVWCGLCVLLSRNVNVPTETIAHSNAIPESVSNPISIAYSYSITNANAESNPNSNPIADSDPNPIAHSYPNSTSITKSILNSPCIAI